MAEIYYDYDEKAYINKIRLSTGQTLEMGFCFDHEDNKVSVWGIYLSIYNKRKDSFKNEDLKLSTGLNPVESFVKARTAFDELEKYILKEENKKDIIICCHWVDNRRRDAYYKVLSKKGYHYGMIYNKKVIMKRFKAGEKYD